MTALRRRIRAVTVAWLLCQVASLSAFIPEQCCDSHAAVAAAKQDSEACHESVPAAPKDGDACPMHRGSQSHDCCKISNTCEGPGAHLLTLFANVGVLESTASSALMLQSTTAALPSPPPLLHRISSPDAPPPKS